MWSISPYSGRQHVRAWRMPDRRHRSEAFCARSTAVRRDSKPVVTSRHIDTPSDCGILPGPLQPYWRRIGSPTTAVPALGVSWPYPPSALGTPSLRFAPCPVMYRWQHGRAADPAIPDSGLNGKIQDGDNGIPGICPTVSRRGAPPLAARRSGYRPAVLSPLPHMSGCCRPGSARSRSPGTPWGHPAMICPPEPPPPIRTPPDRLSSPPDQEDIPAEGATRRHSRSGHPSRDSLRSRDIPGRCRRDRRIPRKPRGNH